MCWAGLRQKNGQSLDLSYFDFAVFHSPCDKSPPAVKNRNIFVRYNKLVRKSFARLEYLDCRQRSPSHPNVQAAAEVAAKLKVNRAIAAMCYCNILDRWIYRRCSPLTTKTRETSATPALPAVFLCNIFGRYESKDVASVFAETSKSVYEVKVREAIALYRILVRFDYISRCLPRPTCRGGLATRTSHPSLAVFL